MGWFICIFSKTMKKTHGLSLLPITKGGFPGCSLPSKHVALCSLPALHLLYKIEDDNQKKRSAVWS